MKTRKCGWSWAGIAACLVFMLRAPVGVQAQDTQAVQYPPSSPDGQNAQSPQNPQDANTPDPPSRVARLNYMDGSVSFQPGGENDWGTAGRNPPRGTGKNLGGEKYWGVDAQL